MAAERSLSRLVKAVGRRGGVVIGAAFVVATAGAVASMLVAKTYRAEARIEVASVGGLNGDDYLRRVQAADDDLRSRATVAEAVKASGVEAAWGKLSEGERAARVASATSKLADGLEVELLPPDGSTYTVVVSERCSDPDLCAKFVGALAESYRRVAADHGAAQAQATAEQAGKSSAEAKSALDRASAEHAAYVKENRDFLEGAKEKLQTLRDRKAKLQETVESAKQQKAELADLLAKEKQFKIEKVRQDGAPDSDQKTPNEQWTKLDEALRAAESRLNAASMELREANSQEKDLEAFAKRAPDREAKAASLADAETAARKLYETRSQEFTKAEAVLSDARARGSLSVRMVAPAERPTKPSGPGPVVFALAGLVVGAVAGAAAAAARATADRSFHDVDAVAAFLGVPVLGAVQMIRTPAETARRLAARRRRVAVLTALGAVAAAATLYAAAGGGDAVRGLLAAGQGGL